MSESKQRGRSLGSKPWIAVALVLFSLLVFTTVHTSPLSAGSGAGSSLSQTAPKDRHSTVQDFACVLPVFDLTAPVPHDYHCLLPAKPEHPFSSPFFGRFFNLPPPVA